MKQYDNFPPFQKRRGEKHSDIVKVILKNGLTTLGIFQRKKNDIVRCFDDRCEIDLECIESWEYLE